MCMYMCVCIYTDEASVKKANIFNKQMFLIPFLHLTHYLWL